MAEFPCGHPRTPENIRRQGVGYACRTCWGRKPCTADGCDRLAQARGLCTKHYHQAARRGDIPAARGTGCCSVSGCDKVVRARGMCRTHYQQHNRANGRTQVDNRGRTCEVDGCIDPARVRRRCIRHNGQRKAVERYMPEPAYLAAIERQGGRCAICGTDDPGRQSTRWCIDHDHACCTGPVSCGGCVRGLLCHNCNAGLGHFQDDPDRLVAAAAYVLSRADLLKGLGSARAVTSVG